MRNCSAVNFKTCEHILFRGAHVLPDLGPKSKLADW